MQCLFDGCAYGLQSRSGFPLKKPWRVQSSCPRHAALLTDRCPGISVHPLHEKTSGREARRSESYTPLIIKRLVAGLLAPSTRRAIAERSRDVLENDIPDEPASGHQTLLAVKTLHSNLGHPGPRALARAIRLSGGSDEAVSAALSYKCPSQAPRAQAGQPGTPERPLARLRRLGVRRPVLLGRSSRRQSDVLQRLGQGLGLPASRSGRQQASGHHPARVHAAMGT